MTLATGPVTGRPAPSIRPPAYHGATAQAD